jgi:hypothetical protein
MMQACKNGIFQNNPSSSICLFLPPNQCHSLQESKSILISEIGAVDPAKEGFCSHVKGIKQWLMCHCSANRQIQQAMAVWRQPSTERQCNTVSDAQEGFFYLVETPLSALKVHETT